jgi:hypothetical protein
MALLKFAELYSISAKRSDFIFCFAKNENVL